MSRSVENAFAQAVELHRIGNLAGAEIAYREILVRAPTHRESAHLLGVVLLQRGQPQAALPLIDEALRQGDTNPAILNNRGMALHGLGRRDEAKIAFERAIELDAAFFDAWLNLGNVHRELSEISMAAACYRRARKLRPNDVRPINNLGTLASDRGRHKTAEVYFRRVLALDSSQASAWNNLGLSLIRQGRTIEAKDALETGLAQKPKDPDLLSNFAGVVERLGTVEEAEKAYQHALRFGPEIAAGHGNYGNFLRLQGRLHEAALHLRRAVELQPHHGDFFNNLGLVMQDVGRVSEATALFRKSIQLNPRNARAWNNLGISFWQAGEGRSAIQCYERAETLDNRFHECGSNRLLALHYTAETSRAEVLRCHLEWADRYAPFRPTHVPQRRHRSDRPIRVGYVSADFRAHSVSTFVEPIFENHDRAKFEIFAYSDVRSVDSMTDRLSKLANTWVPSGALSDNELAERVRADEIDILVDLGGHTARNRLMVFAQKPAPIQATFLGYPDITGLTTMDYRLTDHLADPVGSNEEWPRESPERLPVTAWCYRPNLDSPPPVSPPRLKNGYVTFGCFNNFAKISPPLLEVWVGLMRRVPNSRLILKNLVLGDAVLRERTWKRFAEGGIAQSRVDLLGWEATSSSHLARYNEIDVALDTFPYHGTTTTCEALWMGVPTITAAGSTHASRVGVSLLTHVGLTQCIASDLADYVIRAGAVAENVELLSELRQRLRPTMNASPLCNAADYVSALEAIYSKWTSRRG